MYRTISLEKTQGIMTVMLNRPESLNAIDMKMREELNQIFQDISRDNEVKVVILCGKGKAFCAGGDTGTMGKSKPNEGRLRMKYVQQIIRTILTMDKPIIAAIQGYAMGGGMNLAMACDFVIASEDIKLCQSFKNIGLVSDWGGFYVLPRKVGVNKAKELMMLAPVIDGDEALKIGLVNKVVKKDELMAEAQGIAEKLAVGPSIALALCKAGINKSLESSLDEALEFEAMAQDICMQTEDFQEGLKALKEKRKATFK